MSVTNQPGESLRLPPFEIDTDGDTLTVRWWSRNGSQRRAIFRSRDGGQTLLSVRFDDREFSAHADGPDPRLAQLPDDLTNVLDKLYGPLVEAVDRADIDPLDALEQASDGGDDPLPTPEAVDLIESMVDTIAESGEVIAEARAAGFVEEVSDP